jgi:hypothetical protein
MAEQSEGNLAAPTTKTSAIAEVFAFKGLMVSSFRLKFSNIYSSGCRAPSTKTSAIAEVFAFKGLMV